QSPSGGSSVTAGSTVTICVSSGSSEVSIPNVVGKSETSAANSLINAGFSVSVNYEYSSSVSSGRVISQSSTGTGKKGSTITITVSKGAEQTETKTETTTKASVSDNVTSGSSAR
ncbi:MAG: PASTA domain-containing protein, partial [Clostridiales bacterium]|nr:PASTA domain-containing protein [Clostridiales bacterium]